MTETPFAPARGYMMCAVPRTGSTLLANALIAASCGNPKEYFSGVLQGTPMMTAILGDLNVIDGLHKIFEAGSSPNGTFGVRVHWPAFRHFGLRISRQWDNKQRTAAYNLLRSRLPELLSVKDSVELLHARFADETWQRGAYDLLHRRIPEFQYIWQTRQNMVARAISEFRALRTGAWYAPKNGKLDITPGPEPEFELAEIHIRHCLSVFFQEQWKRFFDAFGIAYHTIVYEELIPHYEETARGTLIFLNAGDAETPIAAPVSERQGDSMSEEWEVRYRELIAEAGID